MPKRNQTKIGARDIELLTSIDRCPLTVAQLFRVSQTFQSPFTDEGNLRRRLRALDDTGLLMSWRYAMASEGPSPKYFKLSRDGYRMLYGLHIAMPRRRYFQEIRTGHHHHTNCLADLIVHLITSGHKVGVRLLQFSRENSLKIEANGFILYPDCAFQLVTPNGGKFNFVVELDNGTERVRSKRDVESIERKLRGYDLHQSQFAANDDRRYLVLFVTTRSSLRTRHILDAASDIMQNTQRTVFLGCDSLSLQSKNPYLQPLFCDHRGLLRSLLPREQLAK